jgi:hypothetical protein
MKTKVLTAVSAAALLGISSFALAQSSGTGGGSGSSSAPPANTMQRQQDAPPANTTGGSTSSGSMSGDRVTQDKDSTKSNRAQSPDSQKSTTQSQSGQMGKDSKSNQAQTPSTDSKSQMSQDRDGAKDGAKSGSTVGAAGAGSVNLTTEQRTTIRQEVLTTNAPRATNVNFTVNVGTVVPSSVRVVEVPTTIVKIHPQWKGYRYFVYNDDIIIVEPRSLKIVAVLNV